jgi:cytochrome c-type biogenesis protein CcmH/NrfG
MLLDQRKTRRMAQIAAIVAAVGFVGIIFIVVAVLVFKGGGGDQNDPVKLATNETRARPNDPVAWDDLATAQNAVQNFAEAAKAAQKAFDLRPNDTTRLITLASLLLQSGEQAQAFTTVEKFTAKHPRNPQGFFLLGRVAEQAQKKSVALLAYATFVRLAPNDPSAQAVRQRILFLRAPPATTTTGSTASTPSTPSTPSGTVPAPPVPP